MTSRGWPAFFHSWLAWSLALLSLAAVTAQDAQAQQADLAAAKTVNNSTPNVGDTVTFTIVVTNNRPATATGVTAVDLLPGGLSFLSATPSQGTYSSLTGQWTIGTLAAAATVTMPIAARMVTPDPRTNIVTVTSALVDP